MIDQFCDGFYVQCPLTLRPEISLEVIEFLEYSECGHLFNGRIIIMNDGS